jgi:gamma-glutamyl phosphate reductase
MPMVIIAVIMESRPNIMLLDERAMISVINPNAGIINIYTSGCPKNQNKC